MNPDGTIDAFKTIMIMAVLFLCAIGVGVWVLLFRIIHLLETKEPQ